MGRLYIFAVGGTGARVMRSLTMLMSAGELANYEVVPVLIDYDVDNGDLRQTNQLMHMYKNIHDKSCGIGASMYNEGFFRSPLTPITSIALNNMAAGNNTMHIQHNNISVSDLLDYPNLIGNGGVFKSLLDSLFTIDPHGEMNQNLCVGFKGNAKIARIEYAALEIHSTIEFQTFLQCYFPNWDKVVIIGSTFGGTGSAGVIEILKLLKNNNHIPSNDIATVLIEPYFLPTLDPIIGPVDYHSVFTRRSKEFFKFYSDSGLANFINTTYRIGMDGFVNIDNAIGGPMQRNTAHPVELLSAMAICDYAQAGQQGQFEYNLGQLNLHFCHDMIEKNDFYQLPDGCRIYESLSRLLLAARFYKEYSNGNQKVIHSHFYREMQRHSPIDLSFNNTLCSIVDGVLSWLEELSSGNRFGLGLFNVNDPMDRMIRGRQYVRHGIFFHLFAHDIIDDFIEKMNTHYHSLRHDTIPSESLLLKLLSKSSLSIFQQFQ